MDNIELAAYLERQGYSVHNNKNNSKSLFFGDLNFKSINNYKLASAAEKAGYKLTNKGWVKVEKVSTFQKWLQENKVSA